MPEHPSRTLTLNKTESVRTFASALANRGIATGFDVVRLPGVADPPQHATYIPDPSDVPLTDTAPTTLGGLVTMKTDASLAYLGGLGDVASLPQTVASQHDAALIQLDGAFTSVDDMFGTMLAKGDAFEWASGVLSTALRLTCDGPVVLHIEDAASMGATSRDAILTLVGATDRIKFGAEDESLDADLGNLTVVFSDVATPDEFAATLGGEAVFSRAFDVSMLLSALQLFDDEGEQAYLRDVEGLSPQFAEWFVQVAVQTRDNAERADGVLSVGIPPHALVKWVRIAQAFDAEGIPEPIHRAAESAVVNIYYSSPEEHQAVTDLIKSGLPPEFDD